MRFDTEVYNGKMYMLGFRTGTAGATDGSVWVLDLATQVWSDTGVDMPVPVSNYTIAKLTDAAGVGLYLFGGRDSAGACTTTVQAYYPDTNTTAQFAADPWTGQVNGEIVFPGAVEVVGNKAYAWGGFCGTTTDPYVSSDTLIFDPMAAAGSRWTAGQPALGRCIPVIREPRRQSLFDWWRYVRRFVVEPVRQCADAGPGQSRRGLAEQGLTPSAFIRRPRM
ncbi:MAG: hypothetical protein HZY76_02035 [Anaerolineae bacterium]|nr:MAG: hypothetical protein HZY76_02035 [Anaerolineae bacterium]